MMDTDKSSWRKLLAEFEEEGHSDLHINGHEHQKQGGVDDGGIPSCLCQAKRAGKSLPKLPRQNSFSHTSFHVTNL